MPLPVQQHDPASALHGHVSDGPAPLLRCTNCEAELHGPWCAQCGEKQPDAQDWSLAGLVHEAMHTLANVDGSLWRTLTTLVRRPGMLTAEYFSGRKSRYVRPLSLFIALNVAFFVIQPRTGLFNWQYDMYTRMPARMTRMEARRVELGLTPDRFRERFDAVLATNKQSMLLFEMPLFALAVAAVQLRRRRPLAQHVVFAIHAYAFFALYLGLFIVGAIAALEGLAWLARASLPAIETALEAPLRVVDSDWGIVTLIAVGVGTWLALALRRVYGDGWVTAVVGALLLLVVQLAMISYQGPVVFALTLRML